MTRTHVAHDGYLDRVLAVVDTPPTDAQFVAFGRLVNPKGRYDGAPRVALYHVPGVGGYAVRSH